MQTATTSVYRRVPRVQFTYITKLTCPFCSLEWMSDLLLLPFLSGGQISPVQSRGTGDGSRLLPSTARRTEKPLRLSSEPLIAALSTVRPSSFAASSLPPTLPDSAASNIHWEKSSITRQQSPSLAPPPPPPPPPPRSLNGKVR